MMLMFEKMSSALCMLIYLDYYLCANYIRVYIHVKCICVFVHLSTHAQRDQKKAPVPLTLDEITSGCELFDVGAGTKPPSSVL